jgi:hypothetical protein
MDVSNDVVFLGIKRSGVKQTGEVQRTDEGRRLLSGAKLWVR